MKKLIAFLIVLLLFSAIANTQTLDTTSFYGKMNYLYANISKAPITTGLLRDYGIDFQELNNYTSSSNINL